MHGERMQILLSPEQRRRLEHEAQTTGKSVSALIREAIDARYPTVTVTREERMAAVEHIASLKVPFIPPDELKELIDEPHTEEILRGMPDLREPARLRDDRGPTAGALP
ncbi:MAG: CopG family transcriptional regulator [Egibacteraceae bacterium]